jgi:hypothetical protein
MVSIEVNLLKKIINNYFYQAFGLSIKSMIKLPELLLNEKNELFDIEIFIKQDFDCEIDLQSEPFRHFVFNNQVLFNVPDVANFLIKNGKIIMVSPLKTNVEEIIRLYILGTCMGVILMQRGMIPLHGSAVAIDGKAYAIVGDSGAGKSTLASAFIKEGYKLLSDDVIAISQFNNDEPYVIPSYPQQKLWQESLNHFGENAEQYSPIYDRESKFSIPISFNFSPIPRPLAGVIELIKSEGDEIKIRPIHGLDRFQVLFEQTYRNFLITKLGLADMHFQQSASIIKNSKMFTLQRPMKQFTAFELVSTIIDTISQEEAKC